MVGTMFEVANGRYTVERVTDALETGDRELAGITAPGCGLTLVEVMYPDYFWRGDPPAIGGPYLP
jgi:tRNA pseudouridine38-40 synthase